MKLWLSLTIPNLNEWPQPVITQDMVEPSARISGVHSDEALKELYDGQFSGLSSIAQQLATFQFPNADYQVILLEHSRDVETHRAKIVDEEEGGNIDAWLDGKGEVTLE